MVCTSDSPDFFLSGIVRTLQNLHDELVLYKPPNVVHPSFDDLTPKPKKGLVCSSAPDRIIF